MLPVEAQTTALAPDATAAVMAMVMPRSLKDPVGFMPSTLRYTSSRSARTASARGPAGCRPHQGDDLGGFRDGQTISVFADDAAPLVSHLDSFYPQYGCNGIDDVQALDGLDGGCMSAASVARWVTIRSSADSMLESASRWMVCRMISMETPCSAKSWAIRASTPGWSASRPM